MRKEAPSAPRLPGGAGRAEPARSVASRARARGVRPRRPLGRGARRAPGWKSIATRSAGSISTSLPRSWSTSTTRSPRWRHKHVLTVERIIGNKRGTGGSAGAPYLRVDAGQARLSRTVGAEDRSLSFKRLFSRSLGADPDRLHFAAHSHHLWPDASFDGQIEAWNDAARLADRKWDKVMDEVWPAGPARGRGRAWHRTARARSSSRPTPMSCWSA